MGRRHSLRFRVALAFAGLGSVLSLLLAFGIWLAAQDVSLRLMDETLEAELADYMARRARNPRSLPPATASLTGFLIGRDETPAADLPAGITDLPPGRHNVMYDGIPHRVAIAERNGERYVLLFDETHQKQREQRFLAYLSIAAGLMTLLAAIGGLWLAGRVIAPVSELAAAVGHADPQSPPRLSRESGPGDEIDELALAFDRYLDRLAAFIERERAFAADASHELRTPLAAIRGAVDVLADDPALGDAQKARIARIERASAEMNELIAALLLLGREEDVPVEVPCDAGRIVRDCIERYRALADGRNTVIHLEQTQDVQLQVHPAFFTIVVANLLHNAVTHTRDGSITLRLDGQCFSVSDTGSGIPSEHLDHVFERHFRGSESTGAGIGLSLVKRICERLRWQVSLTSHPVAGTTVTLSFTA